MKTFIAPLPPDDPLMKRALDALRTYQEQWMRARRQPSSSSTRMMLKSFSKPFPTTTSAQWVAPPAHCTNLGSAHNHLGRFRGKRYEHTLVDS